MSHVEDPAAHAATHTAAAETTPAAAPLPAGAPFGSPATQEMTAENEEAGRQPVTGDPQSGTPDEEESRMSQNVAPTTAIRRTKELVDGLRALADFIEANPDLDRELGHGRHNVLCYMPLTEDARASIAAIARAGMRAGAEVTKNISDDWGGVKVNFGPRVGLDVYAERDRVCERVVTGTEQVVRQVPDPEALAAVPTVEVTETVEQVEWVCKPLLAAGVTE